MDDESLNHLNRAVSLVTLQPERSFRNCDLWPQSALEMCLSASILFERFENQLRPAHTAHNLRCIPVLSLSACAYHSHYPLPRCVCVCLSLPLCPTSVCVPLCLGLCYVRAHPLSLSGCLSVHFTLMHPIHSLHSQQCISSDLCWIRLNLSFSLVHFVLVILSADLPPM